MRFSGKSNLPLQPPPALRQMLPCTQARYCLQFRPYSDSEMRGREIRALPKDANALRVSQHFFNGRVASEDTAQPIVAQRNHSKLDGFLFQRDRRSALIDQFTKRIGNFHK